MEEALSFLRQRIVTAPQPVALALGRVCRHNGNAELVESCLKAAEVLARYLTALTISSFCAREDAACPVCEELKDFRGNLSFGRFLNVLKGIARIAPSHPLQTYLKTGFGPQKDGEIALEKLVEIRNQQGHGLAALTDAKAKQLLVRQQPLDRLVEVVKACQGLLDHPLFLLEDQHYEKKVFRGRRLLLMGDGEPTPDFIELENG